MRGAVNEFPTNPIFQTLIFKQKLGCKGLKEKKGKRAGSLEGLKKVRKLANERKKEKTFRQTDRQRFKHSNRQLPLMFN